jgi:hypothetical protein
MMAQAPPPAEQPRTVMATAPAQPADQRTMMATAPTAAPAPSGGAGKTTLAMSAPTPEMLASLGPAPRPQRTSVPPVSAPPPAPLASLTVKAPEGANSTRPVDVASIQDLLRASAAGDHEKKTSEIDAKEVARLLGEMKNPKE